MRDYDYDPYPCDPYPDSFHDYPPDYDCEDYYVPEEYERLVDILDRIACIDIPISKIPMTYHVMDNADIPF